MTRSKLLLATAATLAFAASAEAKTIQIGIGHQSMCTDTYTAGIVIKELKLLEKHLPQDRQVQGRPVRDHLGRLLLRRSDHQPDAGQQAQFRRDGRLSADRQRCQVSGHQQPAQPLRLGHGLQPEGFGQRHRGASVVEHLFDRRSQGQVGLDAGRFGRLGHAAQGDAGRQDSDRSAISSRTRRRRSAPPTSRRARSTRTPTSARGRRSWNSAAPAGRSTTGRRPASPICTAWSCARTSPRNIPKSSSPSSRRCTTPASGSRRIRCAPSR